MDYSRQIDDANRHPRWGLPMTEDEELREDYRTEDEKEPPDDSRKCPSCDGFGRIMTDDRVPWGICSECEGTGRSHHDLFHRA
jgi:hypothetical protein